MATGSGPREIISHFSEAAGRGLERAPFLRVAGNLLLRSGKGGERLGLVGTGRDGFRFSGPWRAARQRQRQTVAAVLVAAATALRANTRVANVVAHHETLFTQ